VVPFAKAVLVRTTAVIPNLNGASRLAEAIGSLRAQSAGADQIIVADDASTDDSPQVARALGATVVRLDRQSGFAAAVNAGVRACDTDLVAIVNNDVTLDVNWLRCLRDALAEGSPFAVGKMLRRSNPLIVDGCFDAVCRGGSAWRCGEGRRDGEIWSVPRNIALSSFTAVLLRRDYYDAVGGLDETFGSYLEDVDFGLRSASKGYIGRYIPDAIGYHAGSSTLGRWSPITVRYISRNQVLLIARHYPPALLVRFGWPIAVAHGLWGLVALRHGAGLAWVRGKIDGLRLFASHRRTCEADVAPVLGSGDDLIADLQRLSGWDWYWRLYFALT
jgi:GT2 family glycosyltransferase